MGFKPSWPLLTASSTKTPGNAPVPVAGVVSTAATQVTDDADSSWKWATGQTTSALPGKPRSGFAPKRNDWVCSTCGLWSFASRADCFRQE